MLKKICICVSLFLVGQVATAGVIEYSGYSRDDSSNVVTGDGRQWLQWNVTLGESINSALTAHEVDGWRLASNSEMADLFNDFNFGPLTFTNEEANQQTIRPAWNLAESGPQLAFIKLFGFTVRNFCHDGQTEYCSMESDPIEQSIALFGDDPDGDGGFKFAHVNEDYSIFEDQSTIYTRDGSAILSGDNTYFSAHFSHSQFGVALVRDIPNSPTASVPEPSSFSLMTLALLGLWVFARRGQLRR